MPHTVYIALGTNLGDRVQNLQNAVKLLKPDVRLLDCSPIYETPPWGYLDQPAFLNQVVRAETDLDPEELLARIKGVEARMGRQKTMLNGPRIIDLDILFYDDLVFKSGNLSIPHPRMAGRAFVLVPLADLAPDLRHPASGQRIEEMLAGIDTTGIRRWSDAAEDCEVA